MVTVFKSPDRYRGQSRRRWEDGSQEEYDQNPVVPADVKPSM